MGLSIFGKWLLALNCLFIGTLAITLPQHATSLPKTYGVLLFDNFLSLDVMGSLAFFNNIPGVQVYFIHDSLSPVPSGNASYLPSPTGAGLFYIPTYTLDTVPTLDVLIVPGGGGTRPLVNDRKWDQFVARVYPELKYLYSVCTGASIVARSGVLDGKNATTNKAAFAWVESQGPNVNWIKVARWVVDGNIWTSSGVEAGTDMAYAFVSHIYGEAFAKKITNFIEYTPNTNSSNDPFAAIYNLTDSAVARSVRRSSAPATQWGVLAYPGFVGLDVVSITAYIEGLVVQPGYTANISLIAPTLDLVLTSGHTNGTFGQSFLPTHTLANPPPQLDVLIVPGLPTTGRFPDGDRLIAYIKAVYPSLKHIISVGTGSTLLAAAGILDGRSATTSKALFYPATAPYRSRKQNIKWTTGRWVRDGNVWTASGTASGLDAADALFVELYGQGATTKDTVLLEYLPSTDLTVDPFAHVWGVKITS